MGLISRVSSRTYRKETFKNKNGTEKNHQGTQRYRQGPTKSMLSRSSGRRYVQMAGNDNGTTRLSFPEWRILSEYSLSDRLPIQTTEGSVCHENLSSQYQLRREYLSGYIKITMESRAHNIQSSVVHMFYADRP